MRNSANDDFNDQRRESNMQRRKTFNLIIAVSLFLMAAPHFTRIRATNSSITAPAATHAPADGAALYASKCAICHGKNGGGTAAWKGKGQPDLSNPDWQKTHSDDQIATRIKDGKGKMPGFRKKLSDNEIMELVKQVRALRR
jgi:cytochrome c6